MLFKRTQTATQQYGQPQNNRNKIIALIALAVFVIFIVTASALFGKKSSSSENPASKNNDLQSITFKLLGTKTSMYVPNGLELQQEAGSTKFSNADSTQYIAIKKSYRDSDSITLDTVNNSLALNIEGKKLPNIKTKKETFYNKEVLTLTDSNKPLEKSYYIIEGSYVWTLTFYVAENQDKKIFDLAPQVVTSLKQEKVPSDDYLNE